MGVSPGLRRRPLILGTSVFSLESGRWCVCAMSLSLLSRPVSKRRCGEGAAARLTRWCLSLSGGSLTKCLGVRFFLEGLTTHKS